jgi:hypothetical protein
MLQSYSAELHGSQLVWLDKPPLHLTRQRVLVVVESLPEPVETKKYQLADLAGHLQWQGDALAVQRAQRDAW